MVANHYHVFIFFRKQLIQFGFVEKENQNQTQTFLFGLFWFIHISKMHYILLTIDNFLELDD